VAHVACSVKCMRVLLTWPHTRQMILKTWVPCDLGAFRYTSHISGEQLHYESTLKVPSSLNPYRPCHTPGLSLGHSIHVTLRRP
jgi:hypothetical protein